MISLPSPFLLQSLSDRNIPSFSMSPPPAPWHSARCMIYPYRPLHPSLHFPSLPFPLILHAKDQGPLAALGLRLSSHLVRHRFRFYHSNLSFHCLILNGADL